MLLLALATPLGVGRVAAQDDAFLTVAEAPGIGAFLADAEGMTLYLFTPDTEPNESTCDGRLRRGLAATGAGRRTWRCRRGCPAS